MSRYVLRPAAKRDPDDPKRWLCRWCGGKVRRPRRLWCSQACVDDYIVRANGSALRAAVLTRDRGVCAACGLDCLAVKRLRDALRSGRWDGGSCHHREFDRHLLSLGLDPRQSLWEADHIRPVVEGGGGCGLDNIRTLCRPCHSRETAALARRRALERRGAVPLPMDRAPP